MADDRSYECAYPATPQWPASGVSRWTQRFPGDAPAWYAWTRESDAVPPKKCGHIHKSEAAAEKCGAKA